MTFIWPIMLLLLAFVPLLVGYYFLLQRRRRRFTTSYHNLGFVAGAGQRLPGIRRHVPPTLFMLSLTILIFALARPQTVVNLPRVEGTVILTFDVSGSMAADDLKPTRMEAAKTAAQDFIGRQPESVQIGVVAFSDNGFAVQKPTNDENALLTSLSRLTPQRGTSLGQAILASLDAINQVGEQQEPRRYTNLTPEPSPTPTPVPKGFYKPAVIILLTDGENNERPDPLTVAQEAADQGVRIYTVGIGSPEGTTLHINGFTVHTQLDEGMLKQISQITGGEYYNADNREELLKVYDHIDPQLVVKPEKMEVTSIFAGAGILVLLVGGVFSLLWFSRLP